MTHISQREVQTWLEQTKLSLENVEDDLEAQIAVQALSRIAQAYDVSGWTTAANTPQIVRSVLAMLYAAAFYNRAYSEDQSDTNDYARMLASMANDIIDGIINGDVVIIEVPQPTTLGTPSFYPTDASSAAQPTLEDPSLGGAAFTMGSVF
jgi:hypothetical protein